jgi:hypothetical protein
MDDESLALRSSIRVPHYDFDETVERYSAYDDPGSWLVDEVCNFLFAELPEAEVDERLARFDGVMANERERLIDGAPADDDVVLCILETDTELITMSECPSAALLLELCNASADIGDQVSLTLVYGDGSRTVTAMMWPFPMGAAVEATTPIRAEDADADAGDSFYDQDAETDVRGRADFDVVRPLAHIFLAVLAGAVGGLFARRR